MKADSPKRPRAVGFRSYETSRMGKATETECGLAVARGWGEGVGVTANGYRVFGGGGLELLWNETEVVGGCTALWMY